jgi:hypothetical protein
MTINHRAEAERHLSKASFMTGDGPHATPVNPAAADHHLRMAQVHATLAAGQATTADASSYRAALTAWRGIVAHSVAWGLMHADTDVEHGRWRDVAQRLDEAGLNIDLDIDRILPSIDCTPAIGWDPPTVRAAKRDLDAPF